MTTILFSIMSYASQSIFIQGLTYDTELEKQFGSTIKTTLVHDGAMLILNQTTPKLAYKTGENITVNTELINIGNKTVTIGYCEPWVAFEIKNQAGDEIWPNSQLACIPELTGKKTLQPGEHVSVQPWSSVTAHTIIPSPRLSVPGNYIVLSVAVFTFNTNSKSLDPIESLWSEPLQITILPDKVPDVIINKTNNVTVNYGDRDLSKYTIIVNNDIGPAFPIDQNSTIDLTFPLIGIVLGIAGFFGAKRILSRNSKEKLK